MDDVALKLSYAEEVSEIIKNIKVGTIVNLFVRGGKKINKVYEPCICAYVGSRYLIFLRQNGQEVFRRRHNLDIKPMKDKDYQNDK